MAFKAHDGKEFTNRPMMKAHEARNPKMTHDGENNGEKSADSGDSMKCPHCGAEIKLTKGNSDDHSENPMPMGMGGAPDTDAAF